MRRVHKILPILAVLALSGCQTDALSGSGDSANAPAPSYPPEHYFPRGTYRAQLFSGMMRPAGHGTVTVGRIEGFFLLNVSDARGKSYMVRFSDDLSECVFPGNVKLPSKESFAQKSGGALGRRIDRVWSTDRFMVVVGITLDDSRHVIYLRDRATNDPLLIAKFEPDKAPEPTTTSVAPPAGAAAAARL